MKYVIIYLIPILFLSCNKNNQTETYLNSSEYINSQANFESDSAVISNIHHRFSSRSNQLNPNTRKDIYTQLDVDKMIARGRYVLNGFRFENKNFSYTDFIKGSFRGTDFINSNIDYSIAKEDQIDIEDNRFEETYFGNYTDPIDNLYFSFWVFPKTFFDSLSIRKSEFSNSILQDVSFRNVKLEQVSFVNKQEGYIDNLSSINTNFSQVEFESTKINSSYFFGTTFSGCTFKNFEFISASLKSSRGFENKIEASNFLNGSFFSGSMQEIKIYDPVSHSTFSRIEFIHPNLYKATIKAWFKDGVKFYGRRSTNMDNINWMTSIFENTEFGTLNSTIKIKIRNNNFSKVEFRDGVTFFNCDLTNSIFPSVQDLKNAGVKFIDCNNAPYNN